MSITKTLFLATAILFFIVAIGWTILPNFFGSSSVGLFLNGYDLSFKQH